MARPNAVEVAQLAARAREGADPSKSLLIGALAEFLFVTGAYVRAGMSLPVMIDAFDNGVTALMYAANGEGR